MPTYQTILTYFPTGYLSVVKAGNAHKLRAWCCSLMEASSQASTCTALSQTPPLFSAHIREAKDEGAWIILPSAPFKSLNSLWSAAILLARTSGSLGFSTSIQFLNHSSCSSLIWVTTVIFIRAPKFLWNKELLFMADIISLAFQTRFGAWPTNKIKAGGAETTK